MPVLKTQKDFRKVNGLPFCYFCGEPFNKNIEKTRDHIPPKSIFLPEDRTPPLILNAHNKCNGEQSYADNEIGQLINILHDKIPAKKNKILQLYLHKSDEGKISPLIRLDLEEIIFRWIKGFHAALNNEYLSETNLIRVHTPLNPAIIKGAEIAGEPIQEQQIVFVDVIKKNRKAGKLDSIVCNNGKCKYECLWYPNLEGKWLCIFALQVYNWLQLGDSNRFPLRGCVGFYSPVSGIPEKATLGTEMNISYDNQDILDPFGA